MEISRNTIVYSIISNCPEALDIFLKFGFEGLRDPVKRETKTKQVTISQACENHNVDYNKLSEELRKVCTEVIL